MAGWKIILRYGQGDGLKSIGLALEGNGCLAITAWGGTNEYFLDSQNLADDQWHHVIWSLDNGTAKTYVDGALVDTRTHFGGINGIPLSDMATETGEGCIGQNTLAGGPTLFDEYWKGKIDQVRIYSRAPSSLEVAQLYQSEYEPRPRLGCLLSIQR